MENGPLISDLSIQSSIHRGFSIAVFDYQRVPRRYGTMISEVQWHPTEQATRMNSRPDDGVMNGESWFWGMEYLGVIIGLYGDYLGYMIMMVIMVLEWGYHGVIYSGIILQVEEVLWDFTWF